jgi:uracil-DNA glycosylase
MAKILGENKNDYEVDCETDSEYKQPVTRNENWDNLILQRINQDWTNILTYGEMYVILKKIIAQLKERYSSPYQNMRPYPEDIFNFARFTHLGRLKYVFIGQDPYHTESHAHGFSFSGQQANLPSSLNVIYACLIKSGLLKEKPKTGDLTGWAAQGALLLNASLTVEYNRPGSHTDLWRPYTEELIKMISSVCPKLIFLLWGNEAQKLAVFIDEKKHEIKRFYHPNAHGRSWSSECTHFKEISEIDKQFDWDPTAKIIRVYTDGSTEPNKSCPESVSGYACLFSDGPPGLKNLYILGNVKPDPIYNTNIRAEGKALISALEKIVPLDPKDRPLLHIVTDCDFWINCIYEWIPAWKAKKEDFYKKKNPDILIRLDELYEYLYKTGTQIAITHIPSHGKQGWDRDPSQVRKMSFYYNQLVDQAASRARKQLNQGDHIEIQG